MIVRKSRGDGGDEPFEIVPAERTGPSPGAGLAGRIADCRYCGPSIAQEACEDPLAKTPRRLERKIDQRILNHLPGLIANNRLGKALRRRKRKDRNNGYVPGRQLPFARSRAAQPEAEHRAASRFEIRSAPRRTWRGPQVAGSSMQVVR